MAVAVSASATLRALHHAVGVGDAACLACLLVSGLLHRRDR
jgi:hypothetical protein